MSSMKTKTNEQMISRKLQSLSLFDQTDQQRLDTTLLSPIMILPLFITHKVSTDIMARSFAELHMYYPCKCCPSIGIHACIYLSLHSVIENCPASNHRAVVHKVVQLCTNLQRNHKSVISMHMLTGCVCVYGFYMPFCCLNYQINGI